MASQISLVGLEIYHLLGSSGEEHIKYLGGWGREGGEGAREKGTREGGGGRGRDGGRKQGREGGGGRGREGEGGRESVK